MSIGEGRPHYSADFEPDEDGWYVAVCNCGEELGIFPTAEDGCDALMDHAYATGVRDGVAGHVSLGER